MFSAKGSVIPHVNNVWEIRINGVKNCKGLFDYFDLYNLITKKRYSYSKWKIIHSRLISDHLFEVTRQELVTFKGLNKI